jgi:hypothetical protein
MLFAVAIEPRSLVVFAVIAAVTTWLVFRTARRTRSLPEPTKANVPSSASPEAERWQVELYDFARDVEARLNTKIAVLQQLIATADERIVKLESLGLDEPRSAASASSAEPASPPRPHFDDSPSARHAAVYAMADAGNNAAAIANRLGTPIGEVELILSLRRRNAAT